MKTGTINTIIGTNSYAFPTDLMRLFSVKYDGTTLQEISQQDIDNYFATYDRLDAGNGTPTHYWTYESKINLNPVPDSVKLLKIRYNRYPTDVAVDGDNTDVDRMYDNRILDYCYAQASQIDGDMQAFAMYMQRFEGKVDATKEDETEMAQQKVYASITVSVRDAGEFPFDYYGL